MTRASLYDHPHLYDAVLPAGLDDAAYVRRLRRRGGRVLELACGSGRLTVPLAKAGLDVTAVDLSKRMLASAREKVDAAGVNVTLVHGDMRRYDLGRRFDSILVAHNSLLHMTRDRDLEACLGRIRHHLAPHGLFYFDVFNPSLRVLNAPPDRRQRVAVVDDPARGRVTVEGTVRYDAATQVNHARWYFSTKHEPDFLVAPLDLRCIFPNELPRLLSACGLTLVGRFGDHAHGRFTSASRLQVCVARRSRPR